MRFPSALKGISKILASQILQIVSSLTTAVGLVILVASAEEMNLAVMGTSSIVILVAAAVVVVALILEIVGLIQAKNDEKSFLIALILTLIALGFSVAQFFLNTTYPLAASWMDFAAAILSLCAMETIVIGIRSLAMELGNERITTMANAIQIMLSILWAVILFLQLFSTLQEGVTRILGIIGAVLEIVVYIAFIVLLGKARKMLAE